MGRVVAYFKRRLTINLALAGSCVCVGKQKGFPSDRGSSVSPTSHVPSKAAFGLLEPDSRTQEKQISSLFSFLIPLQSATKRQCGFQLLPICNLFD